MIKTRIFESTEQLASETLKLLRTTLQTPGNLMLSGGSTPYAIYNQLAAAPCPVHPDRTIFLSDERMVPADSPNNNAENLMPMLRALGCEDRFIRVDTGLPIEHAAELFARDLEYLTHETTDAFSAHRADSTPMRSCSVGSMSQSEGMGGIPSQPLNSRQPQNPIDLGFLGMGSDGHTAGFFTPEQANLKSGALTLHTNRPDGMQGISVTPALFQRVKRIILLVTGESKRNIINTLLNAPATIPAGIALSDHPHAELWTDNLLHQQE